MTKKQIQNETDVIHFGHLNLVLGIYLGFVFCDLVF